MKGNDIRELYLNFFKDKGHLIKPSFSLVPVDDPSLLLIAAGMAPLKPFFTGKMKPPHTRMATSQKCVRTNDIENVGRTARHHTFFEMLGNFSFGDYFKKEAIAWGWEFVTEYLKLHPDQLWISIHTSDDEAFAIWKDDIGLSPERIIRMEDNFWEIGTGPCGPCSEIYVDMGEEFGCGNENCAVGCDCDRYLEIWNLVFTQFDRDDAGNYTPLAKKNIDTGAGLERLASVMQKKRSNYETDLVFPIIEHTCSIAGVAYGDDAKTDVSLKVIADHARSMTVMISDGIMPSNEGRGYVLRRILRRAIRHGKLLGIEKMFLADTVDVVVEIFATPYPELRERADYIKKILQIEEERFNKTLQQGLELLNKQIVELEKNNEKVLSGKDAFRLYDTFGFPWELTQEILDDYGILLDKAGFEFAMEEQRQRARDARQEVKGVIEIPDLTGKVQSPTKYDEAVSDVKVVVLFKEGRIVEEAVDGDDIAVIIDKTPFYAEGGGQVSDIGEIVGEFGRAAVYDVRKLADGTVYHLVNVTEGTIKNNECVKALTNTLRHKSIARNHTATHLLQSALRSLLGEHVQQSGSMVTPERLRFDFTHFAQVNVESLQKIEDMVNAFVLAATPINIMETNIEKAKEMGAMALFGEKYSDNVRVVVMGKDSIELCGGSHLSNTSEVGLFKIVSEESIGSGLRRIEAVTGIEALRQVHNTENRIAEIAAIFKASTSNVMAKIETVLMRQQELEKEVAALKGGQTKNIMESLLKEKKTLSGVAVIVGMVDGIDSDTLRQTGDQLRNHLKDGVVVLAAPTEEKVSFLIMCFGIALQKGLHAGNLIKEVAKIAGGGGGGKPEMAQAGGRDPKKTPEALAFAQERIGEVLLK